MIGRTRLLAIFVTALLLVSCKMKSEGSNRETATTQSAVAPTAAAATDTTYIGGGGNNTTSTGPTSTDTAAMSSGGPATGAGATSSVSPDSNAQKKAITKKATEPGRGAAAPGKKH